MKDDEITKGDVFKWSAIGLGAMVLVWVITNFLSAAGSVVSAPGRVLSKTMQTDNIIQSYEWFYDVNAGYDARLGQIKQFKAFYHEETDKGEKSRLRIDLASVQQTCRDLATKYNANSQKMNKSIFKGWTLPDVLKQSTCE